MEPSKTPSHGEVPTVSLLCIVAGDSSVCVCFHTLTSQQVCCTPRHAFPGRVRLYLKYPCSPQGFLHTVAQRGCKWGLPWAGLGVALLVAALGAEVSVCTVQLLGTHARNSRARTPPASRLATALTFVLPFDICDFSGGTSAARSPARPRHPGLPASSICQPRPCPQRSLRRWQPHPAAPRRSSALAGAERDQ